MYMEQQEYTIYDTHAYIKRLIKSGMPEKQAECVVGIFVKIYNAEEKADREILVKSANERELALDNND